MITMMVKTTHFNSINKKRKPWLHVAFIVTIITARCKCDGNNASKTQCRTSCIMLMAKKIVVIKLMTTTMMIIIISMMTIVKTTLMIEKLKIKQRQEQHL
jgi:hypothetical protein